MIGITAFVLAVIGFFVPYAGPFIVLVALILAIIDFFLGEDELRIATLRGGPQSLDR